MPQTEGKTSAQLGIRLEGHRPTYTPGDTIVGQVYRKAHIVAAKATIKLTLHARCKSRLVVRHGSAGKTYRGRFELTKEAANAQTLLDAPLHIPVDSEEQSWPFTFTLPTHLDPTALASGISQEESYLVLEPASLARRRVPPSFFMQDYGFGEGFECFVEYYLHAELKTRKHGSKDSAEAIWPLTIATLDMEPLASDVDLTESTQRLDFRLGEVPTQRQRKGSAASTRSQRAGRQDSIATFPFDFTVRTPMSLRLDQLDPIYFYILAAPHKAPGQGSPPFTTQKILISEISIKLVAMTNIKCHGRKGLDHGKSETKVDLGANQAYQALEGLLYIPWVEEPLDSTTAGEASNDDEGRPTQGLNLGHFLDIRLKHAHMWESFETYNIQHTHRLEWDVTVQIEGQEIRSSGAAPIRISAPSSRTAPIEYARALEEDGGHSRHSSIAEPTLPPAYAEAERHELPPRPSHSFPGVARGLENLWLGY